MICSRRELLVFLAVVSSSSRAAAFGQEGAFHARLLRTEQRDFTLELSAARHWSSELIRRTSAPGRLAAELLVPTTTELLREPFVIWSGTKDEGPLSARAIRSLREYLRMGGILLVDDREPSIGQFSLGARRELGRILPESAIVKLPENHVLFKTFYIIDQPVGRVEGPGFVEAIVRGNTAQVLFLKNDLLGALARRDGTWAFPMMNGDSHSREMAIRFAINISMYVLCSDYKDDQVHAPFLMRRRHQRRK